MRFKEAILEFGFDCRARKLSDKTISNYQKQLRYGIKTAPAMISRRGFVLGCHCFGIFVYLFYFLIFLRRIAQTAVVKL